MADPSSLLPSDSKLSTLGLAVGNTSYLRIYSWGSLSGLKLSLNWRLEHQGKLGPIQSQQYSADSGRTAGGSPTSFNLGAVGVLTAVSVTVVSGTPSRGQCYVKVELRDDAGEASGAAATSIKLISGYIQNGRDLVAPFDESPLSGFGRVYNAGSLQSVSAGVFSIAVPAGSRWLIRSLAAYLSASTQAQLTLPQFYLTDGTQLVWRTPLPTSAPGANVTMLYEVTPGYPVANEPSDTNNTLRLHAKANWAISPIPNPFTLIGSIQLTSGVAWASTPLLVEEFIDPN